jgi:hypothetical protein
MITRRDFLKLSGLLSAAMFVTSAPWLDFKSKPVEVEFKGRLYRGTTDGKIYVSEDHGQTWSLHSQFGTHLSISDLYADFRHRLVAVLECQGHDFKLTLLQDARTWKTI